MSVHQIVSNSDDPRYVGQCLDCGAWVSCDRAETTLRVVSNYYRIRIRECPHCNNNVHVVPQSNNHKYPPAK